MAFVAIMLLDQHYRSFHRIRVKLSVVVLPIQYIVSTPIGIFHWLSSSVVTQQHLVKDNARLRAHELLLQSKLQQLSELQKENVALKQLLRSTTYTQQKSLVASLLSVSVDSYSQSVMINQGEKEGVYQGQPLLDAYGVMGQVVEVGPLTSKVLLITDVRSAVPVQDYRNGIRAIAVGTGASDRLKLIHVPKTSDIKEGDLLVASGLGGIYPVGYPVGKVTKFAYKEGDRFATIYLKPMAHIDRSQQLLLIWVRR